MNHRSESSSGYVNLVSLFLTALLIGTGQAGGAHMRTPLHDQNEAPGDRFGSAVSISSNRAVVGSPCDVVSGLTNAGSVSVFKHDGTNWLQECKLTASDAHSNRFFGCSVAVGNGRIVVGARGEQFNLSDPGTGSVYVFECNASSWTQTCKLVGSDTTADDRFGEAVSVYSNRIAVGSPFHDHGGLMNYFGSVYIFDWDGSAWNESAEPFPVDGFGGDYFGSALSLSEDRLAIGTPGGYAAAYVFDFDGVNWNETLQMVSYDSWEFGCSVALQTNCLLVGDGTGDGGVEFSGKAYYYEFNGTIWTQKATLSAADGQSYDRFGTSVAMDGNGILIGACFASNSAVKAGAAYLFERSGGGWSQTAKYTPGNTNSDQVFGEHVSLSGARGLISALGDFAYGVNAGLAYVLTQLTPASPIVTVQPATMVGTNSAQLNGVLVTNGSSSTHVYLLWGSNDAGQVFSGWSHTNDFGSFSSSNNLTTNTQFTAHLQPAVRYYYCFLGVNSDESSWSDVQSFYSWGPPAALPVSTQVTWNTSSNVIALSGVDVHGSNITYEIVTGPAHGSLGAITLTNRIPYTPVNGFCGVDTFTYKVRNSAFESGVATVTVFVRATVYCVGGNAQTGSNWWSGSWANLQTAISAASVSGDEVRVCGNLTRNNSDGSTELQLSNAWVNVSGGWDADFGVQAWRSARGLAAEQPLYSVLNANADSSHKCGAVSISAQGVALKGFAIKNGYLTPADGVQSSAGVLVSGSGGLVSLSHLLLSGHTMVQAWHENGGVALNLNSPSNRVEYVSITGNYTGDSTIYGPVKVSVAAKGTTMLANLIITNNAAGTAAWTASGGSSIGFAGVNVPGRRNIIFGSLLGRNEGQYTALFLSGVSYYSTDLMVVANSTIVSNSGSVMLDNFMHCSIRNTIIADTVSATTARGVSIGNYCKAFFTRCLLAGEVSYISTTTVSGDPLTGNSAAGTFFTNYSGNGFFDVGGASLQTGPGGAGFTAQANSDYTVSPVSAAHCAGLAKYDSRGFAYVDIDGSAGYQSGSDVIVSIKGNSSYVPSASEYYYPTDVNGRSWLSIRNYSSDSDLTGTMNIGAFAPRPVPTGTVIMFK